MSRTRIEWSCGLRLAGLGVAMAATLLTAACSKQTAKSIATAPTLAVRAVRVEPRPLDVAVEVTGSVVSSVAVDVKTEFAGRLVTMLKREGDAVTQGEWLAQLDDTNARLSLGQARASLDVAQAGLERAKVAQDHARLESERAQNLLKTGGITDRDFQAAQVADRDARAQLKLSEAQVEQAREALGLAEKRLRDCRILSPISGEVDRKALNPGGWLDGNVLLYRLVDNRRLELETYVASSELGRVKKGQTVHFTVATYPGETFEGTVSNISGGVDMLNRSARVRAAVPNPAGKLKAGMFIKGKIVTGTKRNVIVVPVDAVWRRAGQAPFVYVVENNQAKKREVRTGQEDADGLEITSGLAPGATVIIEQNLELAEGVGVTPRS
ncbi:MAG: efflux RND transporter periplasmic adaptor subunit [Acidobacteriia bacterium]|nr:efflux RND transporter periplasmic adaptor subunit [Terriglobia bacterium]